MAGEEEDIKKMKGEFGYITTFMFTFTCIVCG